MGGIDAASVEFGVRNDGGYKLFFVWCRINIRRSTDTVFSCLLRSKLKLPGECMTNTVILAAVGACRQNLTIMCVHLCRSGCVLPLLALIWCIAFLPYKVCWIVK